MTAGPRPCAVVLRELGLGDLLAAVPALKALRRTLPDHEISLVAPAPLAPLVALIPGVDRHLPAGELQPVPWEGPPPDIAVDLHGNGPASRDLLSRLGPRQLIGFAGPDLPVHGAPVWRDDEPERARWCRLVTAALGGTADPDDVAICRPDPVADRPGSVVVHPGAAYAARRWPAERFAAVARVLAARVGPVVVTAGPGEDGLAGRVADAAGLAADAVVGRCALDRMAALVADARLVVCGDTGVAHLASGYAVPSVLLFGPTPPAWWGPPASGPHRVLWHGSGRGDPWADRPDPALLRITVDEVIDAALVVAPRRQ